jgi:hypothetical protein
MPTGSRGSTTGVVTVRKNGSEIQNLPLSLGGEYLELLDLPAGRRATLKEITESMLPMTVVFHELSASIPPRRDPLPRDEDVQIISMFHDDCVRASKDTERGYSSPIPLRTGISVRYISQYKSVKAPEMSALASCPEEITEEKRQSLEAVIMYENTDRFPDTMEPPELKPRKGFEFARTTQ